MAASGNFEFRALGDADIEAVVSLSGMVWPDVDGIQERTRWAFSSNPIGDAPLVGAFDARTSELAGVRGGIRWPLGGGATSQSLRVVQLSGTCVHPGYRRMGLFTEMTESGLKRAVDAGFDAIFNVSVAASRAGYEKLGWRYLTGFRSYHRIVRWGRVAEALWRRTGADQPTPMGSFISARPRPSFDDVRPFMERQNRRLDALHSTEYNESFFEWRFADVRHRVVGSKDVGYCVYRVRAAGGLRDVLIGDLWPAPGRTSELLAETIRAERADSATVWMSRAHPMRGEMVACGFIPNLRKSLHFGVRPLTSDGETLLDSKTWAAISADIDTF